jgi:hypothetical protein
MSSPQDAVGRKPGSGWPVVAAVVGMLVVIGAVCWWVKSARGGGIEGKLADSAAVMEGYELFGLRLELPGAPASHPVDLPAGVMAHLEVFDSRVIDDRGGTITVTYALFKEVDPDVEGSAQGAISEVRRTLGDVDFEASAEVVDVAGLDGRRVEMRWTADGQRFTSNMLVFVRGKELWQIQLVTEDRSAPPAAVVKLRDSIFASIQLVKR